MRWVAGPIVAKHACVLGHTRAPDRGRVPVAIIALGLCASLACAVATPSAAAPQHRIGVRVVNGEGEFFDRRTGARFVPRGNAYLRRAWRDVGGGYVVSHQATFDVGAYDPGAAETALAAMEAEGYNAVKVFLDVACVRTCLGDSSTAAFSLGYLGNVVDFLRRAKRHRIVVVIAGDEPPWGSTWNSAVGAPFDGFNVWFLTPHGADGFAEFWRAFAGALVALRAPLDAIWAYELGGETWFQPERAPFPTLPRADWEAVAGEGLIRFTTRVRAAIRSVDPTALVTMGFIAPTQPNAWRPGDTRLALPLTVLERTSLDFLDLHYYPGWDLPLAQYAQNFALTRSRKPVVLGELGAYTFAFPTPAHAAAGLQAVQRDSCAYGVDGWLLWTWDTPTPVWPRMWNGVAENGFLARELGPRQRPDACGGSILSGAARVWRNW